MTQKPRQLLSRLRSLFHFKRRQAKSKRKPHLKVECLASRQLLAIDFGMIADLQNAPDYRNTQILRSGQALYYTKSMPESGTELWVADAFGTAQLTDINPGYLSSSPHDLVEFEGSLYFGADDGLSGDELWRVVNPYQFNRASELAAEVRPGSVGSFPGQLTVAGTNLFFVATDDTNGRELWKVSGGIASLVKDINPGLQSSYPSGLLAVGNRIYFSANNGSSGTELWTSDGTSAGTVMVQDLVPGPNSSSPSGLTNVNGTVFFAASYFDGSSTRNLLWNTTFNGASTVASSTGFAPTSPASLTNVNGKLAFVGTTTAAGRELWTVNAFNQSVLVRDLTSGSGSPGIYDLTAVGGLLYFRTISSTAPLWKSDLTFGGTVSIPIGATSIQYLTNANGTLYFASNDTLWKSEPAGSTSIVIQLPAPGKVRRDITALAGRIFFTDSGLSGELWITTTENNGAGRFEPFNSGSANIQEMVDAGGTVWLEHALGTGTALSSVRTDSLRVPGINVFPQTPRNLVNANGTVYFNQGLQLWKTGTNGGTTFITELPFQSGAQVHSLTNVNGTVYFIFLTPNGTSLWKTDGTSGGTVQVKSINFLGTPVANLTNVNGTLYFRRNGIGSNLQLGAELWKSDGTTAGTVVVQTLPNSPSITPLSNFVNIGSTLYFTANDGTSGVELWRSDGTAAGTVMLKDIRSGSGGSSPSSLTVMNNVLYFSANDGTNGYELWKSDGTAAGTVLVKDIRTGAASSSPAELTNVGGTLYLSADDGIEGVELWKSNGTSAGTTMVTSLVSGGMGSFPSRLTNFNGTLLFTPDVRPVVGRLWQSDGTASGTKMLRNTGDDVSNPFQKSYSPQVASKLLPVGEKVFFVGRNDIYGSELFVMGKVDLGDGDTNQTSGRFSSALHFDNGPMLGTRRDADEVDGVRSPLADADDLNGIDDEDGLLAPITGFTGSDVSVSVQVSNASPDTRLSVFFDFDHDGWFSFEEWVGVNLPVVSGTNNFSLPTPPSAKGGTGVVRFRISDEQYVGSSGLAMSGEVEDYLFKLDRNVTFSLPTAGTNDVIVRRVGNDVHVINRADSAVLFTQPIADITKLAIQGADNQTDKVQIDYATGGMFRLPGGIELLGRGGDDALTITGNGVAQATHTVEGFNEPILTLVQNSVTNSVKYSGFETLVFEGLQSMTNAAPWSIGNTNVTVRATQPVSIANSLSLDGGTLSATAIVLQASQSLTGFGTIAANFTAQANTNIGLTGNLTIGNATSSNGFTSLGRIQVNDQTLTLLDLDGAVLGPVTQLGLFSRPGRLVATTGLYVDVGNTIVGMGTLSTTVDRSTPIINSGSIQGDSTTNRLIIDAYLIGEGTMTNTRVTGVVSPGLQSIKAAYGAVDYAGSLIMGIGGPTAGTLYDQIEHSARPTLGGVLDVRLENNYVPSSGDQYTLITSASGYTGQFGNVLLPTAPAGAAWEINYGATVVQLQLIGLSISVSSGSMSENGGTIAGTLSRNNFDLSQSITVNLSSSDTSEATVPLSITIPAGQSTVPFTITAVDDTLLDGPQSVSISATTSGYASALQSINVSDHETLTVSFPDSSFSEFGGSQVVTVTRSNTDIANELGVFVVSSDPSEAAVPFSLLIPAGQASTNFLMNAVDDALLDGTQAVQISVSNPSYIGSSQPLSVTDYEDLQIELLTNSVSEAGGILTARVIRSNIDNTESLTVQILSSDLSEASVPTTVVIPGGQASEAFTITGVDDALLDGPQAVTITASANGYVSGSGAITVTDAEAFTLTLSQSSMSEQGGSITGTLTRLNTDIGLELVITLGNSDPSEASVPSEVRIAAGSATATFAITALDDTLLDGTQLVVLTAVAEGYPNVTRSLNVTDSETVSISLAPDTLSESGGVAVGTLTRSNTDNTAPLIVTLINGDNTELSMPAQVTILAGAASATFNVSAVDDNLLDGLQTVTVSASAPGYLPSSTTLKVTDFEVLDLSLSVGAINEKDGTATATVTRPNTDRSQPLTVNLLSSDTAEAIVPATVVILANQASASFTVTAVDDALLDGSRIVTLTANAPGYVGASKDLQVTDHETLSLTLDSSSISENGGSLQATVQRSNTDINQPLVVQLTINDTTELTGPATVTVPAGQASFTFTLSAVDDNLLDGSQTVSVSVAAVGYTGASQSVQVTDSEILTLSLDKSSISENGGSLQATVRRSNTDINQPLVVQLTIGDTSELSGPNSVTIPAGQASFTFTLSAVDDNLLDGSQTVSISVAAAGYTGASQSIQVTDSETLTLSLDTSSISENGGSLQATVRRSNTDINQPLVVQLTIGDTSELTGPSTVTIPAGQSSFTFTLSAVDDSLLDGTQTVSISVAAAGYAGASQSVQVTDSETLTLSLDSTSISENGGSLQATVRRSNTDINQPLVVQLTIGDTSELSGPNSVTIPAGQASFTFTLSAVDDSLLDGTQTVSISVAAAGYTGATQSVQVTDSETLTLSLDSTSISENGGSLQATVRRSNTDINQPLVVQLTIGDTSELSGPNSVTIPAGQASFTFTLSAVDDSLLDGTQAVSISVAAAGYAGATQSVQVTDSEALTLSLDSTSISENGGSLQATVRRSNTDINQPLVVQLTIGDTSELSGPNSVTIPGGQASFTFTLSAVDDNLLDGSQTVSISVAAVGYTGASQSVQVTDSEILTLSLDKSSISENGGSLQATVRRSNTDINQPLVVQLTVDDASELTGPGTVTIPAGQASFTFTLSAVDDSLLDGTQSVSISVAAAGYAGATQSVQVTDSETLTLSLDSSSISENGGTLQATIGRSNTDINQSLVVQLTIGDASELSGPATVTIPAGQASFTFTLSAVDDSLLDGTQAVSVSVMATGYTGASQSVQVTDSEALTLSLDSTSISENGGTLQATIGRSNTDINQPLVVQLTIGDSSELNGPGTVTIPAGQASFTFTLSAVDDSLLDGTQAVSLSVMATGYTGASQSIQVTDSETLTLSLDSSSISENGGTLQATIGRSNTDINQPLVVQLTIDDASELTGPNTVTIPAGRASFTFTLSAVDDSLLDGTQTVSISVAAAGYAGASQLVQVTDSETLTLSLDSSSISENGGSLQATVRRSNTDINQPLVVQLTTDDSSELTGPTTVTIPAGQVSFAFTLSAVDDSLLDGTQTVSISVAADGYTGASQSVQVTDSETLTLSLDSTSISENGGSLQATVRRSNTDINQPLVVQLTTDDSSELTGPTTVTIPAGQASLTFTLSAVDDSLLDGTQSVSVSVAAAGYAGASQSVQVTDSETLTLSVDSTSISENGGSLQATVRRSNTDINQPLVVRLTIDDASELTGPATVTIPAGQPSLTFTLSAVDDSLLDGTQAVSISIAAVGYTGASQPIQVTDSETLTFSFDSSNISENGGRTRATVTRSNTDLGLSLTVQLSTSDTSELLLPASVIIPAGVAAVQFDVTGVDDSLLDGLQSVQLTAQAAGYTSAQATLSVTDYETLIVTLDQTSISEKNGSTFATIQRSNTDTSLSLMVTLTSSDTTAATLSQSVVIPAGQQSVRVAVQSVNDSRVDGPQDTLLTASAIGYQADGTATLTVVDDDRQFPWQNPRNRLDVNDSGQVTAIDALLVINAINIRQVLTPELPDPFIPPAYIDVNGDGFLSAIDALLVINALNQPAGGEGEGMAVASSDWYFSEDVLPNGKHYRTSQGWPWQQR